MSTLYDIAFTLFFAGVVALISLWDHFVTRIPLSIVIVSSGGYMLLYKISEMVHKKFYKNKKDHFS